MGVVRGLMIALMGSFLGLGFLIRFEMKGCGFMSSRLGRDSFWVSFWGSSKTSLEYNFGFVRVGTRVTGYEFRC